MTKYLNVKTVYGIETVDELNEKDFSNWKEFMKELKRLCSEYRIAGMNVYSSSRAVKGWNN